MNGSLYTCDGITEYGFVFSIQKSGNCHMYSDRHLDE